jgi:AcrR family transcriptional regulator
MRMTTAAARPRRRARRGEGERLRAEILASAKALLAETGDADAVSVRAVADRVGVSTPSIYLHFADKAALMDAVCLDVFTALDREMEAAARESPDPFEGLRLRGMAYVRFALENPEHYRLVMMRTPGHDAHADDPFGSDDIVAGAAFHHLRDAVNDCVAAGVFAPDQDPELVATSLWAAAHGAVSLCLAKPGIAGEDALALCDHVICAAGLGLALLGRLGDHDGHLAPGPSGSLVALLATLAP